MLEHRAFCSSVMANGTRQLLDPNARILQFAAHTFDASLYEILAPLMLGACLAVPNEEARLNDIVNVINDMRLTHAALTPSFVDFIDPSNVPTLRVLILMGEAMSPSQLETWSTLFLINGYGPTESAVAAVVNAGITPESDCRDIGTAGGVRAWIVNRDNHDQLVPVGCTGELLLEGPGLARGYINNPEKTDEVFIWDPKWTKANTSSPGRRFYKTGDLVRYSSDGGCLTYLGRKDTQIKLHGQRIELGEIENQLSVDARIKHSLVLFPKSGFAQGKLVAVASPSDRESSSSDSEPFKLLDKPTKTSFVAEVRERLSTRLPTFMTPTVWLCLEDLPVLTSSKLDRKSVAHWVSNMEVDPDLQNSNPDSNTAGANEQPANDTEDRLVSIWSRVLNIPTTHISLNESFLSLGGDSIAAITCSGFCKKQGLGVTVQDILRSKSIRELASRAKTVSQSTDYQESVEKPFDLSPIQNLHFRIRKEGQGYFNQSILTHLNRTIDAKDLRRAVETLISRHSMLRARYASSGPGGTMQQRITQDVTGSYHWRVHDVHRSQDIKEAIAESQLRVNGISGPILAVDIFNVFGQKPLLSLVAHHLVVDIVSWRIILEDLEDLLVNPNQSASANRSMPFQMWCRLQAGRCKTLDSEKTLAVENLPATDLAYWGMQNRAITYRDAACETFEIDSESTSSLLIDCNKSLRTEPIDIFLATLMHSFAQTFRDRALPVLFDEGHGRQVWDPTIDISRTIGWFTTVFPIFVPNLDINNPSETVIRVKDLRRRVSDNGREDFARRVLSNGDGKSHPCPMEMSFNYVGQHRDLQRQDGLFQLAEQMAGEANQGGGASDYGEDAPRFGLFEISAMVVQGRLRFNFSFNRFMHHQRAIRDWISQCRKLLTSMAGQLRSLQPRPTLSDFPMLSLTYDSLETMVSTKLPNVGINSPDLIEDIYPCSRLQQGVILGYSREDSLYAVHSTYEVRGNGRNKPSLDRLKYAWQEVISHHSMLRTVFAENLSNRDLFCQVVLKNFSSPPVFLQCQDDSQVLQTLDDQHAMDYHQHHPAHRFSICQTASGKLFCRLELSHAAMDGASIALILRDLQLAYSGKLDSTRKPLFKDFMHCLYDSPQQTGLNYWCSYLTNAQPCHFPMLSEGNTSSRQLRCLRMHLDSFADLKKLCETSGITLSTAFNAAWGLTLRAYCGSDDVCFGYMASLRDLPVDEIESVVGPLINLLACRMNVPGTSILMDSLHQIQNDYMDSLPYRHSSLIDIQHSLKLSDSALFNTGVSYQKLPAKGKESAGDIQFEQLGSIHDPAEFPVFVNVEATDSDAQIELNYWSTTLSDGHAQNLASTYLQSLKNVILHQDKEIRHLDNLSDDNRKQIFAWNSNKPKAVTDCIPNIFDRMANLQPDAPAIASLEGNLSYAEVNELSSRLAQYLDSLGVRSGSFVPIDSQKSKWTVVSILAVLKTGGACLPIDARYSSADREEWMIDNGVQVALASPSRTQSLEGTIQHVVTVDNSLFKFLPANDGQPLPSGLPSHPAYVATASGGSYVVLDHSAILTRAESFATTLEMNSSTRLFQYAAHTSDLFLQDVFSTLIRGGCICIIPDENQEQVVALVTQLGANMLSITPSVASNISPSDISGVETVVLSGEKVPRKLRDTWSSSVKLHTMYGVPECSSACIHCSDFAAACEPRQLGFPTACNLWVVDPSSYARLVPIGCTGELVIEGPTLASGYLNVQDPAEQSFVEDPEWAAALLASKGNDDSGRVGSRRMFKTGDLVRYNPDGSLLYVKKTFGAAVDTWEIEDHIETITPSGSQCIVAWIASPDDEQNAPSLAAFVLSETEYSGSPTVGGRQFITQMSPDFHDLVATIHAHLLSCLPSSAVPNLFFPVAKTPLDSTGRLNRQALIEEAQHLPNDRRVAYDPKSFNDFWRAQLADPTSVEFPPLPSHARTVKPNSQFKHNAKISWSEETISCGSSLNAAVLAAWALTLCAYTNSDDIIFGELAVCEDPKAIESSAVITPRRFQIDRASTVDALLKNTETDVLRASPHSHSSLQRIEKLSPGAARACAFNNLLSISQAGIGLREGLWNKLGSQSNTHPLVLHCNIDNSEVQLNAIYDDKAITQSQVETILIRFLGYLEQFNSETERKQTIGDSSLQPNGTSSMRDNLAYWTEYLANVEPCLFPTLKQGPTETTSKSIDFESLNFKHATQLLAFSKHAGVPVSTVLQVVWGLVLRCYTGLDDVCFEYSASEHGVSDGARGDGLISRLNVKDSLKLREVLQSGKTDFRRGLETRALPAEVQQGLGLERDMSLLNTTLSCREVANPSEKNDLHVWSNGAELHIPRKYILAINATITRRSVEVCFNYSTTSLSKVQILDVVDCFEYILDGVIRHVQPESIIGDIDFFNERSCERVREWNSTLPERFEKCAHEVIKEHALALPLSAPAICSWDSDFTYTQLEIMSTRLAQYLTALGVEPEVFVALCFEKSAWTVVAQLAVLKSGGAFASLDPSHPEARLRSLADDIDARIILCSKKHHEKVSKIRNVTFVVDESTIGELSNPSPIIPAINPNPDNAAYAIFTSGTTGKPKVTVVEHVALATASKGLAKPLNMDTKNRSLQFSSYTFDVSVLETVLTLMTGGCVCIPSEEERMNNLSGAIRRMEANFIAVPPVITNTLEPKSVPSLTTIITGGEKITASHVDRWSDRCVINAYGPSEATIVATASTKVDRDGKRVNDDCNSIGSALCGRTWVVDPHNHHRLMPVGAIGEMILEGSNVARGYLNNEQKTRDVFVKDPEWTKHRGLRQVLSRKERMYRSGDLVRYNADGTLTFISRRDTQIKLNGQRIELEEIENQCLRYLPQGTQLAVDVVIPTSKAVAKGLATFFTVSERERQIDNGQDDQTSDLLLQMSKPISEIVKTLQTSLADALPLNMIPKYFLPVRCLPFTTAGKLDRKGLRAVAQSLPKEAMRAYSPSSSNLGSQKVAEDGTEGTLRSLWEKVLDLTPGSVSAEDSFFGLGGDSYSAMTLVGNAQSKGVSISVADIFKHPLFMDMAKICGVSTDAQKTALTPFSLLPESIKKQDILDEVADQCCVPASAIADVYPCSPVQEGLLTLSIQQSGAYIAQPTFRLAEGIDIERFKAAWQATVNELDILRTRIVHTDSANFVQVVLQEEPISWVSAKAIDALPNDVLELPKHNGGSLAAYAMIHSDASFPRYFTWTIHHAVYDGWTVPLILQKVEENYAGAVPKMTTVPYGLFIDHLFKRDMSSSDEFWKFNLSNLSSSPFPQNKNPMPDAVRVGNSHSSSLDVSNYSTSMDLTLPVLIRAAWAAVVATHTGSGDVCFGETLMGRNIDLPGVTDIVGPTLTTVPTRIQVGNELTISQYLDNVRQLSTDMIPHQHSGLQRIRKLSDETALACDFQNLLVIQADDSQLNQRIWKAEDNTASEDFFTHPIVLECQVSKSRVLTTIHHDEIVVNSWLAQKLISQFNFVLDQLLAVPKGNIKKMSELEVFSPQDKEQVAQWNSRYPAGVDRCIHDVILENCFLQPESMAVCGWDGQLSYGELYEVSSALAKYLQSRGVGSDSVVPICLDKSIWAAVAILSVLMTGGAFIPLDPAHPISRHEEILSEVNASVLLCSPHHSKRFTKSVKIVIPVNRETVKAYGALNQRATLLGNVTSSHMAYILFTSGSTGRAKGIVMEHRAVVSSISAFAPVVQLDETSRVFQFASLTFDAAILEVLGTLLLGGCICFPSEDERLNDVAGAIRRMNVTWIFLTPAIAGIIEPSTVPSLKVLTCGGEAVPREIVTRWAHALNLICAYGPTETTIFAALNTELASNRDPACIGHGIPCTLTWIVDAENHHRLTPLGGVGELALEGPALAREYLKNPQKTADAFVDEPAWISSFVTAKSYRRRIYKTGDLVRYNSDGSLQYMGRKDHQVKLHGQRMELGEIDCRLNEDPRICHALVILPKTGLLQKRLVTVLSLNSLSSAAGLSSDSVCELVDGEDLLNGAYSELDAIQKNLMSQLPGYMVPQTWAVIKKFPMLVSGKLDRKKVTAWVESADELMYDRIMHDYDTIKRSKVEKSDKPDEGRVLKALQDIFSQVLNLPSHALKLNRSFVGLGKCC